MVMMWLMIASVIIVGIPLCICAYRDGKDDGYEQGWVDSYEYNKHYKSKIGHGGKK